jgi:ubiquinone biosynthesis protein Coq4
MELVKPNRIDLFLKLIDKTGEVLNVNVPPIVQIEKLRLLPAGTFGRTLADFLERENLSPFVTGPRRKQLHDSVHLLTGYATDAIGELEVQAFLLGSKFQIVHIILGLGILRLIYRQKLNSDLTNRLSKAFWRGKKSKFDVDVWQPELQWELSINEVRAQFCL